MIKLTNQSQAAAPGITIVDNWFAELKARVPKK
jgi:hypothetical protein